MQFTARDLDARIAALQAMADARGLAWRGRVRALPRRDPYSVIGVFAEILEIDFHSALHPDRMRYGLPAGRGQSQR
jgi:hypothetical protein